MRKVLYLALRNGDGCLENRPNNCLVAFGRCKGAVVSEEGRGIVGNEILKWNRDRHVVGLGIQGVGYIFEMLNVTECDVVVSFLLDN